MEARQICMWTGKKTVVEEGDLVILFETHNSITYAYMKRDEIYQNRHGAFHHNDMIGHKYGLLAHVQRVHLHFVSNARTMEQSTAPSNPDCVHFGCECNHFPDALCARS
ncbi:hypothetical protein Ae201684P_000155 [Aphanomyces euteiches]|nr:hypothetical protein Ae201684P_000155 [Aphanomyces euteiches]